ncbi:MAG: class I SAM-dependent methyltransferase [Verrucomicrobiaceae bacterium]|nr:class I SAM-dependent methyltransferase [Verrucomicrobiaceae bacterium]
MADTPFEQISRFYDSRVAEFGHHPKACDYGRPESQRKKFQVLSSVCRMEGKSLLDVGCGFADYASFLNKKFGNVAYEGVDLSAKMIEQGLALYPGLNLRVHNILDEPEPAAPTHDIVTANGIFYLLGDVAPTLMRQLVKAMFARAKVAVAFNSLSTWAGPSEPGEFNADPLETLAWCREITPWVVLRHDYMPHDFTIFLYREQLPLDPA